MNSGLSAFGEIYGNLPLLQLRPQAISKLPPNGNIEFRDQLVHNCIRRAWIDATLTRVPVRTTLHMRAAQAGAQLAKVVYGREPLDWDMRLMMDIARIENEHRACFGFFLIDEVDHLIFHQKPGPVLRSDFKPNSELPNGLPEGVFIPTYVDSLRCKLESYRSYAQENSLARETVDFVHRITGKDTCIAELPDELQAYFDLADFLAEVHESKEQSNAGGEEALH